MSTLRFSDGMEFDTSGEELRAVRKSDGWYVVGRGLLCPVNDLADAERTIAELNALRAARQSGRSS